MFNISAKRSESTAERLSFFGRLQKRVANLPRWAGLVLINMAVMALLFTVVFLAGETYYRFVYDQSDAFGLTRVHERWMQRYYHYNHAGARDNINYTKLPPPNMRRITFVGDSFTAAHGVKDVEKRFANIIRRGKQGEWEIHVLADNGMDTGEEIDTVARFVANGYKFDVLVLVYCLNDIADIVPEWKVILDRIYGDQKSEGFLLRHSYFLNTVYYHVKGALDPDISNYYGFVKKAYDDSALWRRQVGRLKSLTEFCEHNGIRLMVVTFPFLNALGEDYSYADVHGKLGNCWKALGVPHLDLLSVYAGHKPRELVVNRYDAHPNERAHAMAAEAIAGFVEQHLVR